jgi:uncharacterized protein YqeY
MLKERLQADMKAAMRSGDKERLGVIRLIHAAIKQREIDERSELGDAEVLAVLEKMLKQRRDSIAQYEAAGRDELAARERFEVEVCREYLPPALSEDELEAAVAAAVAATGAGSVRDMGRVMAVLKPQLQGRADMAAVSAKVKERLGG